MLMVAIFKHLIHIFMLVFVISIAGMLYIVSGPETDNMGVGDDTAAQVNLLDQYISHHPMYFGIQKIAEKTGHT